MFFSLFPSHSRIFFNFPPSSSRKVKKNPLLAEIGGGHYVILATPKPLRKQTFEYFSTQLCSSKIFYSVTYLDLFYNKSTFLTVAHQPVFKLYCVPKWEIGTNVTEKQLNVDKYTPIFSEKIVGERTCPIVPWESFSW